MIFATGDTHGEYDIHKLGSTQWRPPTELTKDDYLIILGDFGLLWKDQPDATERYWLEWLQVKPWTTLVVDGNHENFNRFYALPPVEMFGSTVGVIADGIYHLKRGEVYEIDGYKFFVMGGGLSIDKEYRTLGISYWPQEIPTKEEFDHALDTLDKHLWTVDFILTHVPPRRVIDEMFITERANPKFNDPVARFLNEIAEKATFLGWYCGHMHVDENVLGVQILYDEIHRII